ncbi:MAG: hypothetical protein Q7S66_03040 [bacterium]|nr:hypothetical protein [bacterium]
MNMPVSKKLVNKYKNIINVFSSYALPAWMEAAIFKIGLVGITVIVSVAFVAKVSALSAAGYQMHDMEKKIVSLEGDIQKTRSAVAENSSMVNIQSRNVESQMVAVTKISHLDGSESMVTKR